jgi:hypothetical protein
VAVEQLVHAEHGRAIPHAANSRHAGALGYPHKWNPVRVAEKLHFMRAFGDKVFTGAYIINGGGKGRSKIQAVVDRVDQVAQQAKDLEIAVKAAPERFTMQAMHTALMRTDGMGSFMAGQIVADLRYTAVLRHATDAFTWAPRGPGSTRGMNRLLGRERLAQSFTDDKWLASINTLWRVVMARRPVSKVFVDRACELMDLQNCLCEFDKYMRVKNSEGRARNKYPGRS